MGWTPSSKFQNWEIRMSGLPPEQVWMHCNFSASLDEQVQRDRYKSIYKISRTCNVRKPAQGKTLYAKFFISRFFIQKISSTFRSPTLYVSVIASILDGLQSVKTLKLSDNHC